MSLKSSQSKLSLVVIDINIYPRLKGLNLPTLNCCTKKNLKSEE